MNNLEWSPKMSVGSDEIDNQHKILFSLYNNLLVVRSSGVANKVFGLSDDVLQGLIEYVDIHFKYEEQLMEQINYPDIESHKIQHKIYVNRIHEAQLALDKNYCDNEWNALCCFLSDWLVGHVMGIDQLYTPYIVTSKT